MLAVKWTLTIMEKNPRPENVDQKNLRKFQNLLIENTRLAENRLNLAPVGSRVCFAVTKSARRTP
jgi:hypothetical protein